jgi:hypothetical protein
MGPQVNGLWVAGADLHHEADRSPHPVLVGLPRDDDNRDRALHAIEWTEVGVPRRQHDNR